MSAYFIGIDGGASNIRAVIANENLTVIAEAKDSSANPNVVGREQARHIIQSTIQTVLREAHLSPDTILGVGIGMAGVQSIESKNWLHNVVQSIVPNAMVIATSDYEVALIGAIGARQGILLVAGTGSLAYGIGQNGKSQVIGAWGYLLGDEGSGFWIGSQALNAVTRAVDGRGKSTLLTTAILQYLDLNDPEQLKEQVYLRLDSPVRSIARLAPLVLTAAEQNDLIAMEIIESSAQELALLVRTLMKRLNIEEQPQIAFAGGLLEHDNDLSKRVCNLLGLSALPRAKYSPTIGAVLMVKRATEEHGY